MVKEKSQILDDYDSIDKDARDITERVLKEDNCDLWIRDYAGNKVTINLFSFAQASSRILDQILKTKGKK